MYVIGRWLFVPTITSVLSDVEIEWLFIYALLLTPFLSPGG